MSLVLRLVNVDDKTNADQLIGERQLDKSQTTDLGLLLHRAVDEIIDQAGLSGAQDFFAKWVTW